jgi:plasmid stabilization system protein ParE
LRETIPTPPKLCSMPSSTVRSAYESSSGSGRRPFGTRKLTVIGTPYVLIYRITATELQIVAVWHSAQRRRQP